MNRPWSTKILSKQMFSIMNLFALACFAFPLTHASVVRPKKRKASTVLRDASNNVKDVQPTYTDTLIQTTSQQQQQPVPHEGIIIYEFLRVVLVGGKSSHQISLTDIFTEMVSTKCYSIFRNVVAGDHAIGLRFHRTRDILSMRLSLSSSTKGQIAIQFKVFMNTTGGAMPNIAHSNPKNAPLTDGMDMPLCKICNIQDFMQRNASVYLDVELSIDSAYDDVLVPCSLRGHEFLNEIRTTRHIKGLMDGGKYEQVIMIIGTMTKEQSFECLCPAITTLENYNSLYDYLEQHDMLSNFLIHGNTEIVRKVILEIKYDDFRDFVDRTGILEAIASSVLGDRRERAIELYGSAHMKDKLRDRSSRFKIFALHSLIRLAPLENSMSVKRFLTLSGNEFSNKYLDAFELFCSMLIRHLRYRFGVPRAMKLLTDFIGQPSMLTSMAFANAVLYEGGEGGYSMFIEWGWREAIKVVLKGGHKCGGEKLWQVMTNKFPEKFFGKFPSSEKALVDVLAYFPTKQRLEDKWIWENAPRFRMRLESLDIYPIPTVLWSIIAEYGISSWLDVD